MADKYSASITGRLVFTIIVAILFFWGISHINHRHMGGDHDHAHGHGDHTESHEGHGHGHEEGHH